MFWKDEKIEKQSFFLALLNLKYGKKLHVNKWGTAKEKREKPHSNVGFDQENYFYLRKTLKNTKKFRQ